MLKLKNKAPERQCERCGEMFEQIWFPNRKGWSQFRNCPQCRNKRPKEISIITDTKTMPYTPHRGRDGKGGQNLIHESAKKYRLLRCCPPGTTILGANKPIEDIQVGDLVYGRNGQANNVYEVFKNEYEGDLIRITPRYCLPLEVTPEHPIRITRYVRNDNCYAKSVGKRLKKTEWRRKESKWVKACDLEDLLKKQDEYVKYCVEIPRLKPVEAVTEWHFRRLKSYKKHDKPSLPINRDTSWLLGLYLAEGWASRSFSGLAFHEESWELINKAISIVESLGYIWSLQRKPECSTRSLIIHSTQLSEVLREKFNSSAKTKVIPEEILLHPDTDILIEFLKGYIAGDGHFYMSKSHPYGLMTCKTASKSLALQLQLLIARLGFVSRIERNGMNVIRGRSIRSGDAYEVRFSNGELFRILGYDSPKKVEREFAYVDEDCIFVPLHKVERVRYKGYVYNFSTHDETYLVSNVVTHNCGARWGKDVCCVADFVLKFIQMLDEDYRYESLLTPRVHGWIIAPQLSLTDQNWRYFMEFFPNDWIVDINKAEKKIFTINDGLVEFKSTSNPDSLVSVGLDLLLWTEIDQSENPDKMIEAWANLFTRLQSPGRGLEGKGGLFLGNSTPKGRLIMHNIERQALDDPDNWDVFHFTTMDSPFITEEAHKLAKRSMPERLFRQIWLAEYPDDSGEIFPNLDKVCVGEECPPQKGMMYKAAWDPAQKVDYSTFGIRDSLGDMVYKARWTGMPWTLQLDHVESLCRQYNNCPIDIDVTGGGATLPEAAAERGLIVNSIRFTNERKAEMVSKLSLLCEQVAIRLIADESLIDELGSYRAETLSSGRTRYSAPKGKYDDQVDLCLMLYHDFNDPVTTIPFMGTFLGARRRGS